MIAVIFEAWPAPGRHDHYLDLAAKLRSDLDGVVGFLSVERFQSLTDPGKLLSLSIFRDEEAVAAWRNAVHHRATQRLGRSGIFSDYRIQVARIIRSYGLEDRNQAPADSRATEVFSDRHVKGLHQ